MKQMTGHLTDTDLYEYLKMNSSQEYSLYHDDEYGVHLYSGNDSNLYFDSGTNTDYKMSGYIIIVLCVVYAVTFFVAIVGNTMVCYTVYAFNGNKERSQKVSNYFIMTLSVNDIIIAVVCIPLIVFSKIVYNYWPFGSWTCTTVSVLQNTIILCRGFILVIMTKECHAMTRNPYGERLSKRQAKLLTVGSIILALILSFPLFLYTKTKTFPTSYKLRVICVEEWPSPEISHIYSIGTAIVQYFIPMITLIACYTHISIIVLTSKVPGDSNITNRRLQKRRKTIKLIVIVVISFAICWTPFNIINITGDILPFIYSQKHVRVIWLFSHCLALGNSGLNPILYGWMKKNYRREYRNFVKKLFCRTIAKRHRHSYIHSQVAITQL